MSRREAENTKEEKEKFTFATRISISAKDFVVSFIHSQVAWKARSRPVGFHSTNLCDVTIHVVGFFVD